MAFTELTLRAVLPPFSKSQHVFKSNHRVNQSADLFAAATAAAAAGATAGAAAMVLFSFSFGSAVGGSGFCSKKLILCLMSLALSKSRQEDCELDFTKRFSI